MKLANGKVQLHVQDNANGSVVMKFTNAEDMENLGNLIVEEAGRMKKQENHFRSVEQLSLFGQ